MIKIFKKVKLLFTHLPSRKNPQFLVDNNKIKKYLPKTISKVENKFLPNL